MNKSELVVAVSEKTGIQKKDVEQVISAFIDVTVDTLKNRDKIQLVGFGTFETRHRNEKMGRNPRTGETQKIAAVDVPAFKPGKAFKDAVK